MSLWLDDKYIRMVGAQLPLFKHKGTHTYTFRCPFCGDSAKNRTKTRGYVYPLKDILFYKCHNCDIALPFGAFLKRLTPTIYHDYAIERFHDQHGHRQTSLPLVVPAPEPAPDIPAIDPHHVALLSSKTLLDGFQPVLDYVRGRSLPSSAPARLYATVTARTWMKTLVADEKKVLVLHDGLPYLVIPLCLPDGRWYGAQLRDITQKAYHTFKWGHDTLRTFGLDAVDRSSLVYCVEGPLDALCLPNAIAACGSDIMGGLQRLNEAGYPIAERVLVWDNEPRNREVNKLVQHGIAAGESVVIWGGDLPKDLNEMVAQGLDVPALVQQYTYRGLRAELEFQRWKK